MSKKEDKKWCCSSINSNRKLALETVLLLLLLLLHHDTSLRNLGLEMQTSSPSHLFYLALMAISSSQ